MERLLLSLGLRPAGGNARSNRVLGDLKNVKKLTLETIHVSDQGQCVVLPPDRLRPAFGAFSHQTGISPDAGRVRDLRARTAMPYARE